MRNPLFAVAVVLCATGCDSECTLPPLTTWTLMTTDIEEDYSFPCETLVQNELWGCTVSFTAWQATPCCADIEESTYVDTLSSSISVSGEVCGDENGLDGGRAVIEVLDPAQACRARATLEVIDEF